MKLSTYIGIFTVVFAGVSLIQYACDRSDWISGLLIAWVSAELMTYKAKEAEKKKSNS